MNKLETEDESTHDLIDYIVSRINLSSMFFGIIGNLVCIFVLTQKSLLNRKFNWYLLALAFADLNYCLIVFANYLIYALSISDPPQVIYDLSKITCYLTDYVVHSIDAFCVFLTLILSIDRLYSIMNPIKSRFFVTSQYPKQITFATYLILLLIKSPEIFLSQREYKPVSYLQLNVTVINDSLLSDLVTNKTFEPTKKSDIYVCSVYMSQTNLYNTIHDQILHVYIIYCNIFIPLIVSILPAIIILILNLTLWFFMKNYTKTISTKQILSESVKNTNLNVNTRRNITKSQKSHYFTIIILGIWLLFTTIPYNTLTTHYWISELRLINAKTRLSLTIQGISSAFFNLNHCFNIIIYAIFHKDFRLSFRNLLIKLFNLNPMCQINPSYFKSKHDKKFAVKRLITQNSNHSNKFETNIFLNMSKQTPVTTLLNNRIEVSSDSVDSKSPVTDDLKMNRKISINSIQTTNRLFIPNKNFFLFRHILKTKEQLN